MKTWLLLVVSLLLTSPAHAFDVGQALELGQRIRLENCEPLGSDSPKARVLQASLAQVSKAAETAPPVLRVARCDAFAQVLAGDIVVHPDLALWGEGERLFVLAHELGHIRQAHWQQFTLALRSAIPVTATDEQAPRLLQRFVPRLQGLLHAFEYEADTYAVRLLRVLGRDAPFEAAQAIARQPANEEALTHPSASQRIHRLAASR